VRVDRNRRWQPDRVRFKPPEKPSMPATLSTTRVPPPPDQVKPGVRRQDHPPSTPNVMRGPGQTPPATTTTQPATGGRPPSDVQKRMSEQQKQKQQQQQKQQPAKAEPAKPQAQQPQPAAQQPQQQPQRRQPTREEEQQRGLRR
jgi:hypothetical protein